jgi:uncharacterized protein YjbI with pentapeptide repeats
VSLIDARLNGARLDHASLIGASLNGARLDHASLNGVSLIDARLNGARLDHASLIGASLINVSLIDASLDHASLIDASLNHARLNGASLDGAKGLNKFSTTPLYGMLDQIGLIRSYKLVRSDGTGPYAADNGGTPILYEIGQQYEVKDADTDENRECAVGISLATLDWCMRGWREGYRILIAEHTASDIAAIPIGSDGKYRVFRCKVIGEKNLEQLGLMPREIKP